MALRVYKSYAKSKVALCVTLFLFFFFGAMHDLLKQVTANSFFSSYRFVLPLIFVLLVAGGIYLHRSAKQPQRFARFLTVLITILLTVEVAHFAFLKVTGTRNEFGDKEHQLIGNIQLSGRLRKPDIFWIVLDEYSGGTGLQNGWQFKNPIHQALEQRGFFVADSAVSPYNYTHYSLVSTLDMIYLDELKGSSVIRFSDIVKGHRSIYETNASKLLKRAGYDIKNFAIYDIKDHPTRAREKFENSDYSLIHNQTFPGRVRQDIGWNFKNIFASNRLAADTEDAAAGMVDEAEYRLSLLTTTAKEAKHASTNTAPEFFMIHSMLTHEPFLYLPDGQIDPHSDFAMNRDKYIPAIRYANQHILDLVDSLKMAYRNRDVVIILQGDHGYKFDETDPLFDRESCSILYAVYCTDQDYAAWTNAFNSVNGFRLLFNKYFNTAFPMLPSRTYNLYYR